MSFSVKTKVEIGEENLDFLKNLKNNRILFVCDPFVVKSRMIEKFTSIVNPSSQIRIYDKIKPDPSVEIVEEIKADLMKFRANYVIAIGGGSCIDAAKASIYNYYRSNGPKLNFIVIPTTAGTGSELTNFAVITEGDSKKVLIDDLMLADYALLIPSLTRTVPNFISADTGMDVLTHALEAYISKNANSFTDILALKAIDLVFSSLKKVYDDGDRISLRKNMIEASAMAGIAFNNAGLGICHSLAHTIGGNFHISHGRLNAILLPYVLKHNAENSEYARLKLNELAEKYGLSSYVDIIDKVEELSSSMGIPSNLRSLGKIDENQYKNSLDKMAEAAMNDMCTPSNPAVVIKFDLRNLLSDAY